MVNTNPTIVCPKCGTEIQLTEGLLFPFQQVWKKQWDGEAKQKIDTAKEEAVQEAKQTIEELQGELKETKDKIEEARGLERELRGKLKKTDEREKELDLEVDRKVDEQKKKSDEKHNLEILEYKKKQQELQEKIERLNKEAEEGAPRIKGDALQEELDRLLELKFPEDDIEMVQRGVKGADVIQRVRGKVGKCCGVILWESKNTRNWNEAWIDKLKGDQRDKKADIAVIASIALPEDIPQFGMREGVWVTYLPLAGCLSEILRFSLIEITNNKVASEGKEQKIETLYTYFISTQFKQRIEPIIEALSSVQTQTKRERRAFEKIWAEREKQIEKAIDATAGFYGDIRGIIGSTALPTIETLELPESIEE